MSGDGADADDVRYSSKDIKANRKDQSGFFTNVRQKINAKGFVKGILPEKKDRRKFVVIGVGALTVIVVSSVVLALVLRGSEEPVVSPEEKVSLFMDDFDKFFHNEDYKDASYDELVSEIEDFIELYGAGSDVGVRALVVLGNLYYYVGHNPWLAANTLSAGLDADGVSDRSELKLLVALVEIYRNTGQTNELIDVVRRITELPDDIVLELENWSDVKAGYKEMLVQLVNNGE